MLRFPSSNDEASVRVNERVESWVEGHLELSGFEAAAGARAAPVLLEHRPLLTINLLFLSNSRAHLVKTLYSSERKLVKISAFCEAT